MADPALGVASGSHFGEVRPAGGFGEMRSVGGSRVGEARPAGGDLGLTGGEAHPDMTKHGDVVGSGALARRVDCWPVFPRELAYRYRVPVQYRVSFYRLPVQDVFRLKFGAGYRYHTGTGHTG